MTTLEGSASDLCLVNRTLQQQCTYTSSADVNPLKTRICLSSLDEKFRKLRPKELTFNENSIKKLTKYAGLHLPDGNSLKSERERKHRKGYLIFVFKTEKNENVQLAQLPGRRISSTLPPRSELHL